MARRNSPNEASWQARHHRLSSMSDAGVVRGRRMGSDARADSRSVHQSPARKRCNRSCTRRARDSSTTSGGRRSRGVQCSTMRGKLRNTSHRSIAASWLPASFAARTWPAKSEIAAANGMTSERGTNGAVASGRPKSDSRFQPSAANRCKPRLVFIGVHGAGAGGEDQVVPE